MDDPWIMTVKGPSGGSNSSLDSLSSTSSTSSTSSVAAAGNASGNHSNSLTIPVNNGADTTYNDEREEESLSPTPVFQKVNEDRVDSHILPSNGQSSPSKKNDDSSTNAFSSNLSKFQHQVDLKQQEQQQQMNYQRTRSLSPPPPPPNAKPNHGPGPVIRNYINVQNAPPNENNNFLELGNGRNDGKLGSPEKVSSSKVASPSKEKHTSQTSSKPSKQSSPAREANNHKSGGVRNSSGNHVPGSSNATNGVVTNVITSILNDVRALN